MAKKSSLDIGSLRKQWERAIKLPLGKVMFSKALGVLVPYTGTIDAQIEELSPGHARVFMKDRRKVRNHLKSVHAVALANLAELAGNLAMISGLPENSRFIVKSMSIDYLKKARGPLTAIGSCEVVSSNTPRDIEPDVRIENAAGEVVAQAKLKCLIGPNS